MLRGHRRPALHNGPAGCPIRCCGRGRPVPALAPSEPNGFAVTGPSDRRAGSCPLGLPSKIPNALHASFSGHDAELTAQALIADSYPAGRASAFWFRLRRVGDRVSADAVGRRGRFPQGRCSPDFCFAALEGNAPSGGAKRPRRPGLNEGERIADTALLRSPHWGD